MLTLEMMKAAFDGNKNVRFREEIVGGRSLTIVCYMISDDALWKSPLGTETRGPCFDTDTGLLVALPFEKFFNVNEKEHTQAHLVAAEMSRQMPQVCEKVDGSMINALVINDKVHLKTKKSFYSDVAVAAQAAMTPEVEALSKYLVYYDYTPIFEFTSPDTKIVMDYGINPRFRLIAARSMVNGSYLDQSALDEHARLFNVERPFWFIRHDLNEIIDKVETEELIEGWVIYLPSGRYKVKTKWYMDRHHMIDVRERDVAGFVLDETLDDLIPNMIEAGADMDRVREIEHQVATELMEIRSDIDRLSDIARTSFPLGAERAQWVNKNCGELTKFVFRASRGMDNSDESLKEFYRSRYLPSFSLRSIGNTNFRTSNDD